MEEGAARYALYLAPDPGTALWRMGSSLLGYDAAEGCDVDFPVILRDITGRWRKLTEEPRRYGFHLTLKAPFHLASGVSVGQLERELAAFTRDVSPFDVGPLVVECRTSGRGGGFVCLVPQGLPPALMALEATVVPFFDRFRAPLSAAERARRRPEHLPLRECAYLEAFGYPFVLEAFRPHFSLTGVHDFPQETADQLSVLIAGEIGQVDFRCQSIFLFEQKSSAERFTIFGAFPLGS